MFQLALLLCCISLSHANSIRKEEFSRIKKYEVIYFNTDTFESTNTIEFDAFDQHYKVELIENPDITPSKLRHTNGNPTIKHALRQHFTHLNRSCHYFGKVLNTNESSMVAISMCDKRGIRGSITAFGDTLLIKPAKYYLDIEYDRNNYHHITDEHLVYKQSDFDTTGFPVNEGIAINNDKKPILTDPAIIKSSSSSSSHRRLLYNNGANKVELYILCDPPYTQYFMNSYPSNWYDQLVGHLSDMVLGVSAEFGNQKWGNNVGSINVGFVELEIVFEFNGIYASLYPTLMDSGCSDLNNRNCEINGNKYLGQFADFVSNHKDTTSFDDAQLWSAMNFYQAGGWGYIGTICKGRWATANIAAIYSDDWSIRSAAHEMGHNFDMDHDADGRATDCGKNDGVMGYGTAYHGFSGCSVGLLQQYFADENGLTCLGNGVHAFSSNYNDDIGTPAFTDNPTSKPTLKPTSKPTLNPTFKPTSKPTMNQTPSTTTTTITTTAVTTTRSATTRAITTTATTTARTTSSGGDWNCVGIESLEYDNDIFNGYWSKYGTNDGKPCYSKSGYYLYYHSSYKYWLISTILGSNSVQGYCDRDDITLCSGRWRVWNNAWSHDTDSGVYDCGDSDNNNNNNNDATYDCNYYECVGISMMQSDGYGTSYNGDWKPGGCFNGVSYYRNSDKSRYLCFSKRWSLWLITDTLCSSYIYAYCSKSTNNIMSCSNSWYTANGGWSRDNEVYLNDCSGNNAPFTNNDDISCLSKNVYSDKLCVYNNGTLWNGDNNNNNKQFEIYEMCRNNKPIYRYIVYNESIIDDDDVFGNNNNNDNIEMIYYLHFNEYYLYSDSTTKSGQWIISINEISINGDAICNKQDLLQCIDGNWKIQDVSGDMIRFITDENMAIYNKQCVINNNNNDDDDDNINSNNSDGFEIDLKTIIVVSLVIIAIIVGFGICMIYRNSNKSLVKTIKQNVHKQSMQSINNNNNNNDDDDDDELPDNIEIEVSMERDINMTQTLPLYH